MEMNFYVNNKILRNVQQLVKDFDGRFKHNPLIMRYESNVTITFDNPSNGNKFNTMLWIIKQPFFSKR